MNPREEPPIVRKFNLLDDEREGATEELENIERIVREVENGNYDYAYPDTADSIQILDDLLKEDLVYQVLLPLRREASLKIMARGEEGKREGLRKVREWIHKVRECI